MNEEQAMLAEQRRGVPPAYRSVMAAAILVAAYFATAAISLIQFGINSPLWFANALVVAGLLRFRRAAWPGLLAAVMVADSLAFGVFSGGPAPLLALADTAEIGAIAFLIRRMGGAETALSTVGGFAKFILLSLSVPILSSTWGAGVLSLAGGGAFLANFRHWYIGNALGMLIVCPILLVWFTPALRTSAAPVNARLMIVFLAVLAAMAVLVTGLKIAAFLFVTFPALLLLAWWGGLLGATLGSAVLVVVGLWRTMSGDGALMVLGYPAHDVASHVSALQIYLGALTLSSLPLAVVLTDQRRLSRELVRVADARSEFLAAMSHEIRTPMTGVLGMVDLLDSEAPTPRQRRQLGSIRASGRHLVRVLNDILDFSRIETGKIELERIDFSLPLLLEQVQGALQPLAVERGITLTVGLTEQSPPIVRGDPTRIQQILLNLAGNAVKFTPEGSVLVLAACCPDAIGQRFRFEVRDTGIGLAADQQRLIFSAFTQADHSTSRRYGGSGLGLAISKRLVDIMNGEIGVESTLGEGSLFWFEIPLELGDVTNLAVHHAADPATITPRRVLLAEDVELNRDIICTVLARDGHHVVVAANGREAVDRASEQAFDLILMDVHMPVMDGLDATRAIRALPGNAGATPIFALTANVMASEQEKCRHAGMDTVLMKPVEWDQVRIAIRDCEKHRALREGPVETALSTECTPENGDEAVFDAATFGELGQVLPATRLTRHFETLVADVLQLAEADPGSETGWMRDLAHGIVSQAGMFGLTRLSSSAAALERACETGAALPAQLKRFRAAASDPNEYLLPRLSPPLL